MHCSLLLAALQARSVLMELTESALTAMDNPFGINYTGV